ncbi:GrpB family protein [Streptomyces sp. NPDC002566]|uniref:GrpB family protein n=1 Tax=Streptomyces sp. NPDC002566 TaxID=3364650 RepID=UPI0036B82913
MPYDPAWPAMFAWWGVGLRAALGDAVRIDHIGSTSVPGLAAKPVIDVQISVAWLEATDAFLGPLTDMGLAYRADNPERTSGRGRHHLAEQAPCTADGETIWKLWFPAEGLETIVVA